VHRINHQYLSLLQFFLPLTFDLSVRSFHLH
jgi:hypothetical protein